MADRKWNNQGGSSRDGSRKNKIDKPSDPFGIPSFEDLKESEITSFKIVKQRRQQPNYGELKDAVWVPDVIVDNDLIRDLEDPYRFPDLSTDRLDEIKPFKTNNIKKVPLPNPNKDLSTLFRSEDLLPYSIKDEYELVVKFRKVILTILSGQAYAAREQLNDKKYDSSIVILSDKPIAMSGTPKDVNIIKLVNGVQDPIDSLYDWMMTKTKIVTDGTGKNTDVKLLSISRQGVGKRLPETSFTYAGKQYGLFYVSSGIQPYQICMHARNDVVKFAAGNPRDDKYWSVLNANPPLSLCLANIPTVSIALAPGSSSELEAGSGMSFVLRVTVDPIQSGDTLVEYEITGDAVPSFYDVTEVTTDSDGIPVVNIPNNPPYKDVFIKPLANPSETENKTIVFSLKESALDRYLIDEELVELTILPATVGTLIYFNRQNVVLLQYLPGSFFLPDPKQVVSAPVRTYPDIIAPSSVQFQIIGSAIRPDDYDFEPDPLLIVAGSGGSITPVDDGGFFYFNDIKVSAPPLSIELFNSLYNPDVRSSIVKLQFTPNANYSVNTSDSFIDIELRRGVPEARISYIAKIPPSPSNTSQTQFQINVSCSLRPYQYIVFGLQIKYQGNVLYRSDEFFNGGRVDYVTGITVFTPNRFGAQLYDIPDLVVGQEYEFSLIDYVIGIPNGSPTNQELRDNIDVSIDTDPVTLVL